MIGNSKKIIFWLKGQDDNKKFEIKEYYQKRSLNSNSYCWELCTKIAEKINSSKEAVYYQMLKEYGQSMLIPVTPGTCLEGFSKYYEFYEKGKINGKECEWYKIYKGSSNYDSKEMWLFLEGIIYEAKELDIPTLEDYRVEKMIEEWGKVS